MTAVGFFSRSIAVTSASFFSSMSAVLERMIVPACSTWLLKNSPKFFMYILHFFASTTVVKLLSAMSAASSPCTARITSLSLPTPDGSIRMRSGAYCSITFCSALPKSPTRLQQMQPWLISVTSMPASCINPPSMPISPNSFSMSTSFSPMNASAISFLISVVLPAPRNPEKISIFVIASSSLSVRMIFHGRHRP